MPKRPLLLLLVVGAGLSVACAGCDWREALGLQRDQEPEPREIPPEIRGTVGEYASLVGGGSLLLDGHGLVVGLGKNGSSEVPPKLRKYLIQYMLKKKVGSPTGGSGVKPSQILTDKDTAVVRLVGVVPPGAPVGWRFDVNVSAISRTDTRNLDGGILYPAELRMAQGEGVAPAKASRVWAEAEGSVFVNPFLDPDKAADAPRFREGQLIGGGKVAESRPLRLILRDPDYARCNVIQRRINQRFGQPQRVANARNPATVALKIPPTYRDDYEHFLQLVMHLPIQAGAGKWEARAKDVALAMQKPGANHEGLALVWEAMGRQIVGVCRTLYTSKHRAAAFYAARTGLRLKDELAGDALIQWAGTAGSPFQVPAVEELGRHQWLTRSVPALRHLIDDGSELVRIAAYEALLELGDRSLITRVDVGDEFKLDLVASKRTYVIYATRNRHKKIVLFGRDMTVSRPVFFNMPGDLVTLADKKDDTTGQSKLMAFRLVAATGGVSEPLYSDFHVRSLIQTLGRPAVRGADGNISGLSLTYGQVVAVLYQMCEVEKDIPAKFVLQRPPGMQRIYRSAATVGRPDMPGE